MLTVQQYAKGVTIPQIYLSNAQFTVGILNEIFDTFPNQFTFNSGYRTPAHNKAVGGVADSFHVKALAGDITPKNGDYNQYKAALTAIVAKYGWELIDERSKNHFHIEPSAAAGNQQQPVFDYQPQASSLSELFDSLSAAEKPVVVGGVCLALYLIFFD